MRVVYIPTFATTTHGGLWSVLQFAVALQAYSGPVKLLLQSLSKFVSLNRVFEE